MFGVPGGYEDEFEDEFEFDNYDDAPNDEIPSIESKMNYENESSAITATQKQISSPKGFFKNSQKTFTLRNEEIKNAILKKNFEFVKTALENGFLVDSPMASGWTSLMYAATNGFYDLLEQLVQAGADVNFKHDMFTPLMACCYSNTAVESDLLKCAQSLVKNGAKVNSHDRFLMTSLMYASRNGFSSIVTMLCENDADVNKQDSRGLTAMHYAASKGYANVVKELLKFKADRHLSCMDGQKACDIAFEKGFLMLSEMLENYDPSKQSQYKDIPDKICSQNKNSESNYVLYGDLEVFLHGLQLAGCVNKFKEHHLTLQDLLKIEDQELVEIGITELGIRKKILQAVRSVHTNEWDMSSVKAMKGITKLTTLECAAVIANVTKHISHITSSLSYLNNQLEKKKEILAADDTTHQQMFVTQLKEATKVINLLDRNMNKLNSKALLVFPHYENIAPNVLRENGRKPTKRKSYRIWIAGTVVVVSLVTGVYIGLTKLKTDFS